MKKNTHTHIHRKSLLQHHSSKASILWHSAFFIVQLSHPSIKMWECRTKVYWGPCKEVGGSGLKKPQTPWKPSAKLFYRKGEGEVQVVVAPF